MSGDDEFQDCNSSLLCCIIFLNLYSAANDSGSTVTVPVREPLQSEKGVGTNPERMDTRREEGRRERETETQREGSGNRDRRNDYT